jgi:hypothetical protein
MQDTSVASIAEADTGVVQLALQCSGDCQDNNPYFGRVLYTDSSSLGGNSGHKMGTRYSDAIVPRSDSRIPWLPRHAEWQIQGVQPSNQRGGTAAVRRYLFAMIAVLSIQGWNTAMAQSNPLRVVAEFPGSYMKWIRAAEPEFQRKQLDLDNYNISVVDQESSVVIVLTSSDASKEGRGITGTHPGYEVEVSKKDQKVVRSNYVR